MISQKTQKNVFLATAGVAAIYFSSVFNRPVQPTEKPVAVQKRPEIRKSEDKPLEKIVKTPQKQLFKPKEQYPVNTEAYDNLILQETNYWNSVYAKHGATPLNPDLVKAMILQESGTTRDAYFHDPMQIANKGDFALTVLGQGTESGIPKKGYKELHGIKHTPRKNGDWDYSNSNMTPELSIRYGIRWLFHKRSKFNNKGKISGFRTWEEAVKRYNGGGVKNYKGEVFERIR